MSDYLVCGLIVAGAVLLSWYFWPRHSKKSLQPYPSRKQQENIPSPVTGLPVTLGVQGWQQQRRAELAPGEVSEILGLQKLLTTGADSSALASSPVIPSGDELGRDLGFAVAEQSVEDPWDQIEPDNVQRL